MNDQKFLMDPEDDLCGDSSRNARLFWAWAGPLVVRWRWLLSEGGHDSPKGASTNCVAPFGKVGTLRDDDDLEPRFFD